MLDPNSRIARPGLCLVILLFASFVFGADSNPKITPLVRVVDLSIGETLTVKLSDGSSAIVELKSLEEKRDSLRDAIREARVEVVVNGKAVSLVSANYQLPKTVGGVRIDCSITCGYVGNSGRDSWGLKKDARLRLWPAGSPLMRPGTFGYPLRQRWFASGTQMANEPTFVDGGERPKNKKIYYHNDLDFGGAEGMIDVLAATDGLVVSFAGETLPKFAQSPARKRYDVIYLLDDRGWFYRYSHLHSMDSKIELGQRVRRGQPTRSRGRPISMTTSRRSWRWPVRIVWRGWERMSPWMGASHGVGAVRSSRSNGHSRTARERRGNPLNGVIRSRGCIARFWR